MTTECGQLVRIPANEIRAVGRASKGVRIMNLNENDRITGVAKFKEVEGEKSDDDSNANDAGDAEILPDAQVGTEENNSEEQQ